MNYDGKVIIGTELDTKGATAKLKETEKKIAGIKKTTKKTTEQHDKYNKSVSESTSKVAALGKAVAAAFSIVAIVEFGKAAIGVASDLQEVQNVVDTAFGDMSEQANKFAETSVEAFGLSELTAKKTASTFMAMANGMGLVGQSAADMSLNLTGLTGDMASFYNVKQDVAETALASIFTGETESLKKFGVVMSATNLQQFAYKDGMNKLISEMTEAEKVQLRYNFVLDKTKLAQGDFAKTSTSWANQTRVLTEKFKEFMGVIGEDLIIVLEPLLLIFVSMLDIFEKVTSALTQMLADAFGPFGKWCSENLESVKNISSAILGFFAGIYAYVLVKKLPELIYKVALAFFTLNAQAIAMNITFGLLGAAIFLIVNNWDKMNDMEKIVSVLGAITIAAVAAAVAIGALQSALSYGIAAAAIVAGVAAIGVSVSIATKRAKQEAQSSMSGIPKFAKGGVFHGGEPMLGILNDQPRGQTNVETPLQTMIDAFNISLDKRGDFGKGQTTNVSIKFNGELSQLARILKPELDIENNRIGTVLVAGRA